MRDVDPYWPYPNPEREPRPTLHDIGWMGDVVLAVCFGFGAAVVIIDYLVRGGLQ